MFYPFHVYCLGSGYFICFMPIVQVGDNILFVSCLLFRLGDNILSVSFRLRIIFYLFHNYCLGWR